MAPFMFYLGCLLTICHALYVPPVGTAYDWVDGECPITGTPSAAVDVFIVPVQGTDTTDTEKRILEHLDGQGPPLSNYTSRRCGLRQWYAHITNKQACDIASIAGVRMVVVDGEDPDFERDAAAPLPTRMNEERAATLVTQSEPVTEVRVMLQPTNVLENTRMENYVFPEDPSMCLYFWQ